MSMILLVEAATTIPPLRLRNQAADHLISRVFYNPPVGDNRTMHSLNSLIVAFS
jgi:hypothetical protein